MQREEVALVAQCVEDWAKKQKALSSRLSMDTKRCSDRGRFQNTAKLCQGTKSTTPAAKQMREAPAPSP